MLDQVPLNNPPRRVRMTVVAAALIASILLIVSNADIAFAAGYQPGYTLGPGDKLRVTVFEEEDLSGEFEVDGSGQVSMPLIGGVRVGGLTLRQAGQQIETKLRDGFLTRPRVSIDVLNYRPFYILGEVNSPGNYPFVNGMTVLNAVAMAAGFTYRANKDKILIIRANDPSQREQKAAPETIVLPGDIIRIKERFW